MLNWSITKYKFTLGLGALGIGALLSILWRPIFSPLIVVPIAILPFVLFVMLEPGDFPDKVVRFCQIFGSVWYLFWVIVLAIGLALEPNLPADWLFLFSLCGPGLIPAVWVLGQALGQGPRRPIGLEEEVDTHAEPPPWQ
jgi:hypothetical protein